MAFGHVIEVPKKSTWKQHVFFQHQNYIGKKRGNNMQTTWKERGFSNIEIPLEIVPGNDVDFSISEITSKKYVEMT